MYFCLLFQIPNTMMWPSKSIYVVCLNHPYVVFNKRCWTETSRYCLERCWTHGLVCDYRRNMSLERTILCIRTLNKWRYSISMVGFDVKQWERRKNTTWKNDLIENVFITGTSATLHVSNSLSPCFQKHTLLHDTTQWHKNRQEKVRQILHIKNRFPEINTADKLKKAQGIFTWRKRPCRHAGTGLLFWKGFP